MTKKEILAALDAVGDDDEVSVVISEGSEHLDELEPGSVLKTVGATFAPGVGTAITVEWT